MLAAAIFSPVSIHASVSLAWTYLAIRMPPALPANARKECKKQIRATNL
jgi:hypothetical protein